MEEVVLFMPGSYNPLTLMHLRNMEIAKDHLEQYNYTINRGILSPVHDGYNKDGLISITHRRVMLELALESSNWLQLSTWESEQKEWTRTYHVLRHHREMLNGLIDDKNIKTRTNSSKDINANPDNSCVNLKLVGGTDTLASFTDPNVWDPNDVEKILVEYGFVVIARTGCAEIDDIIYNNDILFKNKKHIFIAKDFIKNDISSTGVRKACARGLSIRYIVPDAVERYIKTNNLYTQRSAFGSANKSSTIISANSLNKSETRCKNIKKVPVPNFKNRPVNKSNEKKNRKTKVGHGSRRAKI